MEAGGRHGTEGQQAAGGCGEPDVRTVQETDRSGREDGSDWVLGHREPDLLTK